MLGLCIEVWKLTKGFDIKWNGWVPSFADKQSYANQTKEHDLYAMKYLYMAMYPCVFFYAIYSMVYNTHKSWYSFVISTLAGCVYTFGFIMMTPQLFINYKLKSVAHLPHRVFFYKIVSTFIDDLFAFLIRMPTLHKLRVLRDDVVFLIYLYQRWIYPVDTTRIEIGAEFTDASVEELEDMKKKLAEKKEREEAAKAQNKNQIEQGNVKKEKVD